jgi:hypothetical protein
MLVCVLLCASWHARPRVQRAPGLPCALLFLGANEFAKLGRSVSRGGGGVFSCHHPRRRMIQYSEEPVIEPRTRGVLDTPPSRSMTAVGGASSSTSLRGALATKQSSSSLPPLDCFANARNDGGFGVSDGNYKSRRTGSPVEPRNDGFRCSNALLIPPRPVAVFCRR